MAPARACPATAASEVRLATSNGQPVALLPSRGLIVDDVDQAAFYFQQTAVAGRTGIVTSGAESGPSRIVHTAAPKPRACAWSPLCQVHRQASSCGDLP